MLTDEQKMMMLTEERYATVRTKVRDAYERCQILSKQRLCNDNDIKRLEDKRHFYNSKKVQKSIDDILMQNDDIDKILSEVKAYLEPLAKEMEELEAILGDKARLYYGRDNNWWIRR